MATMMNVTDARTKFNSIVKAMPHTKNRIIVIRNGEPEAAVINMQDYAVLLKADEISDQKATYGKANNTSRVLTLEETYGSAKPKFESQISHDEEDVIAKDEHAVNSMKEVQ